MLGVTKVRCEYKKNPIGIDIQKPRLSWILTSDRRGVLQAAYQIQVAEDSAFREISWDTGRVNDERSIHHEYNGPVLLSGIRYYYRVQVWDQDGNASGWCEPAFWEMGLLTVEEWTASWITSETFSDSTKPEPCIYLRKDFKLEEPCRMARIYATSLGLYELYVNGKRVGEDLFTPGWTSYNKRLQYQTYDVTPLLVKGENTVGVILGEGWYKGYLAWEEQRNTYGTTLAALVQMHILHEDESERTIQSDHTWKSSTGPILMSDIYMGEVYDARREEKNWCTPGFDDTQWIGVNVLEHSKNILVAQQNVPVRVMDELKPVGILNTPSGETVIDMGQNMTGWVRFRVCGPRGTTITLEHAEVLDKDGNFYTKNLRAAKQRVEYILRGEGEEEYEPHFTFQGFRYVKVEGLSGPISLENFTGRVIHSDMERTGEFNCSDPLVNQLQHNIIWGQKGNFLDVPTDCPQRDERLGWTGDAQVFIRTACFNMNVASFFTKWLKDLASDQSVEKGVPFVIPQVLKDTAVSSAAWGDAAVICPWTLYQCYGDKRILEDQFQSMKDWIEYIRNQGENEYLWNTGFHFGDWLGLDAKEDSYTGATAKDFIATAFYAYSASIVLKTAEVLGKEVEIRYYRKLYSSIVENFRKEFVTPNGRLAVPTQTAHVLALKFNLLEEKDRKRAADTLVTYIRENNNHLSTGFAGTPYLCEVLSKNGYNDLAYQLLLQKDYPSWLYQVTHGATTIWEHWDGIKEDGSFWSPDMNSFNHYAYGSIGDWLYRIVAGIDTSVQSPGYKHIHIQPQIEEGLTHAEVKLQSMYGEIKSAWRKKETGMELNVVIPPNTTATVVLPFAKLPEVKEDGKALGIVEGVTRFEQTENGVRLDIGSGAYWFAYP